MSSHAYTTVAKLKGLTQLGVDRPDTDYSDVISAVTVAIDEYCGRSFVKVNNEARVFECDFTRLMTGPSMQIDDIVTMGMTTVKVEYSDTPHDDWEVKDTNDWWLWPVTPKRGWPHTRLAVRSVNGWRHWNGWGYVRITADWGWDAVPAAVSEACLLLSNRVLNREKSPFGVMYGEWGSVYIGKKDADVENLLRPYKRDYLLGS